MKGMFAEPFALLASVIDSDGSLALFCDASALRGTAGEYRELATRWVQERRTRLRGVHVLFKTRLMEMAINVAALVLRDGVLVGYSDPKKFDLALAKEAPGHARRLPQKTA
jgi:hypothetical protein